MLKLNRKMIKFKWALIAMLTLFFTASSELFADKLFLKQKEDGNNVEILEEGVDAFVVKIPKEEIELIKGEDYSDVKLWKEKKILWEDQGDYITIFLPKERIVVPEDREEKKEGTYYGKGRVESMDALKESLASTGAEATFATGEIPSQAKGNVIGRIFDGRNPAVDCNVKIVYIKGQSDVFTQLFSGAAESEGGDIVFEAKTDENGLYEFSGVPVGNYDLYWRPRRVKSWIRKLSEKPSVTVLPGKTVQFKDINLR